MELTKEQRDELLITLKTRFEKNMGRHQGIEWSDVEAKLAANDKELRSIFEMEITGGEPDVISYDQETDEYIFVDCSPETPTCRRNICYDQQALDSRKANKPADSAMGMASAMGVEMLTVEQYQELQKLGNFDTKTSSWVQTPGKIRKLGGALFCDRRYDTVFVYHNGAESYYSVRGFRASLRV